MARKVSILNKRELIIDSASKLFGHYGYEKTTLDDIAKAAGIGKGTIYSEFVSKEEIMCAVILRFLGDANEKLREFALSAEGNTLETIRELLIQRILMHYDHAKSYFHGAQIFTFPLNNIKGRDAVNLEIEKIIAELLETAASKGEIPPAKNYLKLAGTIRKALITLHPPLVLAIVDREQIIEEANCILDLILAGLTAKR